MVLLLVFMQLTRDLFAIAKFLFSYAADKQTNKQSDRQADRESQLSLFRMTRQECDRQTDRQTDGEPNYHTAIDSQKKMYVLE